MNFSGVHTLGGDRDINHLVSFASFKENGSADVAPHIEDSQGHFQNETSRFHSLQNNKDCGGVEDFLRSTTQTIKQLWEEQIKTGLNEDPQTSLFLHDWPTQGENKSFHFELCNRTVISINQVSAGINDGVIKELQQMIKEIAPRYFWLSLRSNSGTQEMEETLQAMLGNPPVFNFRD